MEENYWDLTSVKRMSKIQYIWHARSFSRSLFSLRNVRFSTGHVLIFMRGTSENSIVKSTISKFFSKSVRNDLEMAIADEEYIVMEYRTDEHITH